MVRRDSALYKILVAPDLGAAELDHCTSDLFEQKKNTCFSQPASLIACGNDYVFMMFKQSGHSKHSQVITLRKKGMLVVVAVNKSAHSARDAARNAHSKSKCLSSSKAPTLQDMHCLLALTTPAWPPVATGIMTTKPEPQKRLHVSTTDRQLATNVSKQHALKASHIVLQRQWKSCACATYS